MDWKSSFYYGMEVLLCLSESLPGVALIGLGASCVGQGNWFISLAFLASSFSKLLGSTHTHKICKSGFHMQEKGESFGGSLSPQGWFVCPCPAPIWISFKLKLDKIKGKHTNRNRPEKKQANPAMIDQPRLTNHGWSIMVL